MFVHFSVRQILKRDFGVAFPVVGGIGNSAKDPAIIESEAGRNYHHAEYDYIKYICLGRKVKWEFPHREKIADGERRIEKVKIKIKIKTQETTAREVITQVENYYFDVTDCDVSPEKRKKPHQDFHQPISELEPRDVVLRMDLDSGQRRSKAPRLAPFGKGDIEAANDALWRQLFAGQISEEAALDAMTDLM
jgi:hypothetical protein